MRRILPVLLLFCAACQALSAPTATPSPTAMLPPSATATASSTPAGTAPPSATPTPSITPTASNTPTETPLPSNTPTPSVTPQPTVGFVFDNWNMVDLPQNFVTNLNTPWLAFINKNDREDRTNPRTPQPSTNKEVLYYLPPDNSGGRVAILQLQAATENQVYISRSGRSIAYFQQGTTPGTTGLYVLDLESRISGRILPLSSLIQRGIFSAPAWSPDGTKLALALATGYGMDVYTIGRDGSNLQNLTRSDNYNFWPSWSPDGSKLLFVSDRLKCPSWLPGAPGGCDVLTQQPPTGGSPFVLDIATGSVTQLSGETTSEPPRWLNSSTVVFSTGEPNFGDPERHLWLADVLNKQAREVKLNGADGPIRLSEAWSPDGRSVIYQSVSDQATEIIAINTNGQLIGRVSDLTFPRFGMSAAWSPDGTRIAIGGVNGQCQYGVRVFDNTLSAVGRGNPPPSMCNPAYSPDGRYLAFTGVNPKIDGRVDVYIASVNGYSAVNMTGSLKGTISMLGWVGG